MIPNCAATRHVEFTLDGTGPAELTPPRLDDWPAIVWEADAGARRVNLDEMTREEIATWQPGDRLLLSGKLLTGRDAAHKRMADLLNRGEGLPEGVDLTDRFIYYVGPVDPGARRGGRPRRPHHRHPHGQVHRADAGPDRPHRHGRQGRARSGRHRGDQAATAPSI